MSEFAWHLVVACTGLGTMAIAAIALIRPLPLLKLTTKQRTGWTLGAGCLVLWAGIEGLRQTMSAELRADLVTPATLIVYVGLFVLLLSCVAFFTPLPKLLLTTKQRAGYSFAVSFGLIALLDHVVIDPAPKPIQVQVQEPTCRDDNKCWGERHRIAAQVRCEDRIEGLAKYDFEWTSGWGEPIFSEWVNIEGNRLFGTTPKGIIYIGDKIKFQNGFGVFIVHTYHCNYDPDTETVLKVSAQPGKMPKR